MVMNLKQQKVGQSIQFDLNCIQTKPALRNVGLKSWQDASSAARSVQNRLRAIFLNTAREGDFRKYFITWLSVRLLYF